ncbi:MULTISPECIES: tripartite tricarboxylate transporter substrate binding protein [Fusobacterium]|uniref:tripartite tricarboxylate transporter substrate binding protein n=1 Tax=Fusobacterium TaxID=848 RepID=UPI0014772B2A|nr:MULTISPECIES: tripartite tricarboxylate transporter substrate binding protein [Fusobacterium]NME36296.1 tripartite tricarboxylate transporter substrate binding protein [Fusobacterium sp. FSA-380-WT-3A]
MKIKKRILALFLSIFTIFGLIGCSQGKEVKIDPKYPKKPVEVIVGFSAGGGTDACARLVFQYAGKYFGQKFAIVNRPGASGEIAWTELSKAPTDGYTIGFINPPTFNSHPVQRPGCKYSMDSFKIIANMVTDPACFVVRANSPINSINDLYDMAKTKNISIGYSGPGTSESLMLRQIEEIKKINLDKIPYDGSAPSVVALLGGHVDSVVMNVSEAITYTVDGSLKLIAVSSRDRVEAFPEVSTLAEQGLEVYNEAYRGVAAPAGMPDEYIAKIEDSIKKALQDPEFIAKAKTQNLPLDYMGSEEFTNIILGIDANLREEFKKGEW